MRVGTKMQNKMLIHEVAQLLDIDASTIRFWERKGLLHLARDTENGYRYFNNQSLIEIIDIIFFRNLQFPIKDLIDHQNATLNERKVSFIQLKKELKDLKEKVIIAESILNRRIEATTEASILLKNSTQITEKDIRFEKIESFNLRFPSHVDKYLTDPSCYILFFSGEDYKHFDEGIISNSTSQEIRNKILWSKNSASEIVYGGLLKVNAHHYEQNNLSELSNSINFNSGNTNAIAQYLASGKENGVIIDYYDCWFSDSLGG